MFSCRWMVTNTEKRAFVAYADPHANEIGTIYCACNFEYLGDDFGASYLFRHNTFKSGKWFSTQSLKRTSVFKKWCKDNSVPIQKGWLNEKGFKNLQAIPQHIKKEWYEWIRSIIDASEKMKVDKKHKYILVLHKNKKEQKTLNALKKYSTLPYIKR
jgi:hypothetical protein